MFTEIDQLTWIRLYRFKKWYGFRFLQGFYITNGGIKFGKRIFLVVLLSDTLKHQDSSSVRVFLKQREMAPDFRVEQWLKRST